jgi:cytochrome d ubiquinol oxidase subunit I
LDPVLLARIQFAVTVGFHFIFPPLTIGMGWLIFYFMSRYKKTRDELFGGIARFWIKVFALTFVVGVATGIVLEFQFGTNWAAYSRFVGDIFGAPLAAEGIFAFFLESTFVGVLIWGWKRFSVRTLWFSSLMVAVGATLSAFWIIVANSWMQTPAGYDLVGGRAELTDFWAAVFNPSTLPRYLHTIDACLITGAFFMLGISAWYLLKGDHEDFARKSFKVSLVAGFVAALLQLPLGHYHAVQVAQTQPEKLAAFEGLFETQKEAPLLIFGIPDSEERTVHGAVKVPGLLSFLVGFDAQTEVKGLNDYPEDEWPPLGLTFYSFHLMFILGLYFIGLTALGLFMLWRRKLFGSRFYMTLAFFSMPLPLVANELGWIAAEVGRQPWIVYRLLKTSDSISATVPAGQVLASLIMFSAIYLLLGALWVFLLRREVKKGPKIEPEVAS